MSTYKTDYYVVICESGRSQLFENKTYWQVLDVLFDAHQSGGSNYDRPKILVYNGNVVVEKGLCEIAWKYGSGLRDAYEEARKKVQKVFWPDWVPLPEGKAS